MGWSGATPIVNEIWELMEKDYEQPMNKSNKARELAEIFQEYDWDCVDESIIYPVMLRDVKYFYEQRIRECESMEEAWETIDDSFEEVGIEGSWQQKEFRFELLNLWMEDNG